MTAVSCGQQEKGEAQAWKTVEGGTIDVDGETGLPTGILREAAAPLVTSLVTGTMIMEHQMLRVLLSFCLMLRKSVVWEVSDRSIGVHRVSRGTPRGPQRVLP